METGSEIKHTRSVALPLRRSSYTITNQCIPWAHHRRTNTKYWARKKKKITPNDFYFHFEILNDENIGSERDCGSHFEYC